MQFDLFRQLMDELVAWKTNYMIFMAPLPKYLEAGCCSDGDHVANRREPDFRQKLEEAVFNSRTNIKNFAFRVGLRKCTTISTWGKIRKLSGLWRDEVRVSDEAHHIIGQAILEAAAELVRKRPTASEANSSNKKPRVAVATGGNRSGGRGGGQSAAREGPTGGDNSPGWIKRGRGGGRHRGHHPGGRSGRGGHY
jgi:hypothetical protein